MQVPFDEMYKRVWRALPHDRAMDDTFALLHGSINFVALGLSGFCSAGCKLLTSQHSRGAASHCAA